MDQFQRVHEVPAATAVCVSARALSEMDGRVARALELDCTPEWIGRNTLECHPEPARSKTRSMLENRKGNAYAIEKSGARELVFQAPWLRNGEHAWSLEISREIQFELPHFVRS